MKKSIKVVILLSVLLLIVVFSGDLVGCGLSNNIDKNGTAQSPSGGIFFGLLGLKNFPDANSYLSNLKK